MNNMDLALLSSLQSDQYITIWRYLSKLIDNMVLLGMDREAAREEVFEVLQDL